MMTDIIINWYVFSWFLYIDGIVLAWATAYNITKSLGGSLIFALLWPIATPVGVIYVLTKWKG